MIDHIGFSVSDYERAKTFYQTALAPLGYGLIMEVPAEVTGHAPAAGFGADGKPDFWIGGEGAMNKPVHIAITAKGPRRRRRLLQGRDGRRRPRQRRARHSRALSPELLRRVRARSRRPQHRGGLPNARMRCFKERRGARSVIASNCDGAINARDAT
ncbi:hypothetical protein ACVWY2_006660 [Bradyrhizobium sp. JR6.1]